MPRSLGGNQADTIQQRARWFGYKEDYLGICRVFMPSDAEHVFRNYIEHEEQLRKSLIEFSSQDLPASSWKRHFFLDNAVKPTRQQVLSSPYYRGGFSDEWYDTRAPHWDERLAEHNRSVASDWSERYRDVMQVDATIRGAQTHRVARDLSLRTLFTELLLELSFGHPDDARGLLGLLLQTERWLELNPQARCNVYEMSAMNVTRRVRSISKSNGLIKNLFQGFSPKGALPAQRTYPGDRAFRTDSELSVQIHRLDIQDEKEVQLANDIVGVAIWVPKAMHGDWIVQDEGQML